MKIPARILQRSMPEFLDLLATNKDSQVEVVDRVGKRLFYASLTPLTTLAPTIDDIQPRRAGDVASVFFQALPVKMNEAMQRFLSEQHSKLELNVAPGYDPEDDDRRQCHKCGELRSELYVLWEDGESHEICSFCAKKSKVSLAKLTKVR